MVSRFTEIDRAIERSRLSHFGTSAEKNRNRQEKHSLVASTSRGLESTIQRSQFSRLLVINERACPRVINPAGGRNWPARSTCSEFTEADRSREPLSRDKQLSSRELNGRGSTLAGCGSRLLDLEERSIAREAALRHWNDPLGPGRAANACKFIRDAWSRSTGANEIFIALFVETRWRIGPPLASRGVPGLLFSSKFLEQRGASKILRRFEGSSISTEILVRARSTDTNSSSSSFLFIFFLSFFFLLPTSPDRRARSLLNDWSTENRFNGITSVFFFFSFLEFFTGKLPSPNRWSTGSCTSLDTDKFHAIHLHGFFLPFQPSLSCALDRRGSSSTSLMSMHRPWI